MRSTRFQSPTLRLMPLGVCTLTLWLTLTAIATADYKPPSQPSAPRRGTTTTKGPRAYNPPTRPSSPRRGTTTTGGIRGGCQGNSSIPLTLLAPVDHVGQSHTTHPTVAWFVPPATSQPVRLRLFEATAMGRGTQLYETELSPTPGVMTQTLPADQPGLIPGKQYIWQVTLLCDRNRPSQNPWLETAIAVEPLPAGLQAKLTSTPDRLAQAQIYAEAGFWYDALALTLSKPESRSPLTGVLGGIRPDLKSRLVEPINPLGITLLQDLSTVESPDQQKHLDAIAEYLQQRP